FSRRWKMSRRKSQPPIMRAPRVSIDGFLAFLRAPKTLGKQSEGAGGGRMLRGKSVPSVSAPKPKLLGRRRPAYHRPLLPLSGRLGEPKAEFIIDAPAVESRLPSEQPCRFPRPLGAALSCWQSPRSGLPPATRPLPIRCPERQIR